jgi:hypothetical protein
MVETGPQGRIGCDFVPKVDEPKANIAQSSPTISREH